MMMHHRIKRNGLSVLRLLSSPPPQKQPLLAVEERLVLYSDDDVGGGGGVSSPSSAAAAAAMGSSSSSSRRLLLGGEGRGGGGGGGAFLVKRVKRNSLREPASQPGGDERSPTQKNQQQQQVTTNNKLATTKAYSRNYFFIPVHEHISPSNWYEEDMFLRTEPDLPILLCSTGRKRLGGGGGGGGGFVPHQCSNISRHMLLPSFAFARRALSSSSTSQSSSQEPTTSKEEEKEEECQTISSSSKLQRATDNDDDSTNVSLNQFPGLMAPLGSGTSMTSSEIIRAYSIRNLLRLNPFTGYFEEQQDVVAAATLPVSNGHVCRGSAYGWLFLTDHDLGMRLFNPFSGAEIQLPPVKNLPPSTVDVEDRWPLSQWFVHKAVFSANPSVEPRPVVLVIYGGQPITRLAFCKPGDKRWTPLEFSPSHTHWDAIFYKGQFYVLSHPGYVAALDIGRLIDDDDHSVKTTLVATPPKRGKIKVRLSYLVVVDGELVKVELRRTCLQDCCIKQSVKAIEIERKRDGDTSDEEEDYSSGDDEEVGIEFERNGGNGKMYFFDGEDDGELQMIFPHSKLCPYTYGVKIRRLDVKSEKQWVKVECLGGKAVFVGYNTSFALSASDYPAGVCIPDSIYFTYGYGGGSFTERLTYDMGIFNLKDESVKPLVPPKPIGGVFNSAPIWIVNAVI